MELETRTAFVKQLWEMIESNNRALEPMEAGRMRLGRREAGGNWEDITQKEIDTLKRINADLNALIDKIETEAHS